MSYKKTMGTHLTLNEWIDLKGMKNVADLLNVPMGNVSHWYHYKALPRPEIMQKIVKHTDGIVSYESIIEDHLKNKKSK